MASILRYVYGEPVLGVVHPPVDISIFRPNKRSRQDRAVLYAGAGRRDTSPRLVSAIAREIVDKGFALDIIGSLNREDGIAPSEGPNGSLGESHHGVPDDVLGSIYSESRIVICPQFDEMFGYVPVEALACGTPVLTLLPHEGVDEDSNGWTGWTEQGLIGKLRKILHHDTWPSVNACVASVSRFAAENSFHALVRTLSPIAGM
jgi:glycosyltransferase involved in cell wall biosynthesis